MPIRVPCPKAWEYNSIAGYLNILAPRAENLLLRIRNASPSKLIPVLQDTRALHDNLFTGLTPPSFPYFAGHYRGESLWCLDRWRVGIPSDPRVGHVPEKVPSDMIEYARTLTAAATILDVHMSLSVALVSGPIKLAACATVAAALFVELLEIHPYANGNGHVARSVILMMLARHGYYPNKAWTIDPRPADPPYSNLISRYRNGDRNPLLRFILAAL